MKRSGFLDVASRKGLIRLARDGLAANRLARRAQALALLDNGMSPKAMARVPLVDDDTIHRGYRLYREDGSKGLGRFGSKGSACRLSVKPRDNPAPWITETPPQATRKLGGWIDTERGLACHGRSGLVAVPRRIGRAPRKPKAVSRKLRPEKRAAFIKAHEALLNHVDADEAILFGDAAHPVGCRGPKDAATAAARSSGRQRLNVQGVLTCKPARRACWRRRRLTLSARSCC